MLARRAFDLTLPASCVSCGNMSQCLVCGRCYAQCWNEPRSRCATCAIPVDSGSGTRVHCHACLTNPPAFNATLAATDYRAPLDLLAIDLKFCGQLAVGAKFARHLHNMFDNSGLPAPDTIVPVPLSKARLIARGYNQAWAIARPLARRMNVAGDASLVVRAKHTAQQSKLDLDAHRRNVADAFALTRDVRGRHISGGVDVMTSGATLDALARTLKLAGARRVTNFVALRTPQD